MPPSVRHILSKVKIDTAESGDEAIIMYKNRQYDIIFLDCMMPGRDGIETLTEMRSIKETKTICINMDQEAVDHIWLTQL